MYLSRVDLARTTARQGALAALLAGGADLGRDHGLIWTLFADDPDAERDFLFRSDNGGGPPYYTLSPRPPEDPHGLWHIESKSFDPQLRAGDRLAFRLRANPVVSRKPECGGRGKRHDLIMDAIHDAADRKAARTSNRISEIAVGWLEQQGDRNGFVVDTGSTSAGGYQQHRFSTSNGNSARLSSVDYDGKLTVTDPDAFLSRLFVGFGPGKAFGLGLMLIRRA